MLIRLAKLGYLVTQASSLAGMAILAAVATQISQRGVPHGWPGVATTVASIATAVAAVLTDERR